MLLLIKFVAIFYCLPHLSESLECFSCNNVTNTASCTTKMTCAQGQKCFTSTRGIGISGTFDLGCKSDSECLSITGNSFIGRSIGNQLDCVQCCNIDYCNKNLCSSAIQVVNEVGTCEDDPTFNCAKVSSILSLCSDIHHAKLSCRKYCGLCNLVDGGWSVWSEWNSCDVSCDSGHMTRTRTCTAPPPVHGGLDCIGKNIETTICNPRICPVHGGWSLWSSWGSCSVTCGIGLERRDRSCSKPYPGPDGDHCFGDSRDDRPCFVKSCSDGVWSTWSNWGTCSATCLGGLQKRNRTCDNPAPTSFGHDCVGTNEEYQLCNNKECRTGILVSFRASNVSNLSGASGRTLIYTNVVMNNGGGYNRTTGIFTAPEPGIYSFVIQACKASRQNIYIKVYKDNQIVATTYVYDHDSYPCASTSALLSMNTGNKVWVTITGNVFENTDHFNYFQGYKIGV